MEITSVSPSRAAIERTPVSGRSFDEDLPPDLPSPDRDRELKIAELYRQSVLATFEAQAVTHHTEASLRKVIDAHEAYLHLAAAPGSIRN